MCIHRIMATPVLVAQIAKYLDPADILFCRSVSFGWKVAFEDIFVRKVPVTLNERNILLFNYAEGTREPRRVNNQTFRIRVRQFDWRREVALRLFGSYFGHQVRTLEIVVLPSSEEMNAFCKLLKTMKGNLRELTVRIKDGWWESDDLDEEDFVYPFPVLRRLKSLTFLLDRLGGKMADDAYDVLQGEKRFVPLVVNACPNLKHLKISGHIDLHEELFQQLKASGKPLKLESLELDQCHTTAIGDLAQIPFSSSLKHLRLIPACAGGPHGNDSEGFALAANIRGFLKHVANDLTFLDLRLKTIFEDERDENGDPVAQLELIVLPVMPKLRSLTLAAMEADDICEDCKTDSHLDIRFEKEEEQTHLPLLKDMYPALTKLRLVNSSKIDLTWTMLSPSAHSGVLRLEILGMDGDANKERRNAVRRQAKGSFPRSDVVFIKAV